ncbi:MAG TPA: hypothetical protein VHO72_01100 [Bacteroidales bacterium]|nr:hypothetical protein [Bacteroidales bacterium]
MSYRRRPESIHYEVYKDFILTKIFPFLASPEWKTKLAKFVPAQAGYLSPSQKRFQVCPAYMSAKRNILENEQTYILDNTNIPGAHQHGILLTGNILQVARLCVSFVGNAPKAAQEFCTWFGKNV